MNYLERLEELITICEQGVKNARSLGDQLYWRGRLFSTQVAIRWFHELIE